MISFPFVYFGALSYLLFRRHRTIDIATIIALMFSVSGLFSIIMTTNHLTAYSQFTVSLLPTLLYCTLITLCILPISGMSLIDGIDVSPIRNIKLFKFIAVFALIWFLLTIILGKDDLYKVLSGDMNRIRNDLYRGLTYDSWMSQLPRPVRFAFACTNMLFGCSWILIFLGFYAMLSPNIPLRYAYYFLIASLSGPLSGIMWADRSSTAYWIISVLVLFIFFRKHIPISAKKGLYLIGIVVISGLILYLMSMTIARFGELDWSSAGGESLITYFGQSFVNYCYFFDNYSAPYHHWGIVFPFSSEYLFRIPAGGVVIQKELTALSGKDTGVFYTFMGHIMIGLGQFWSVFLTLGYSTVSAIVLGKIKYRKQINIMSLYLFFAISSIVLLGLFGHYYSFAPRTVSVVAMYFIVRMLK